MKILILNYEYPPLGGGAGIITKHLAEAFANTGHEISVITTWFEGLEELTFSGNLQIIRLKSKRQHIYRSSVLEMFSWIKKSRQFLKYYLKNHSFDVGFVNFAIPGGIVGLFIKKKFNIPFTIISHGHDIPWYCRKEMFWYHLFLYPYIKHICLKSDINFVQQPDMKVNIDKFTGDSMAHKNIIIPNGCDTKLFHPAAEKRNDMFHIVFAGRLVKQKAPFTFLKALVLLKEKNVPFKAHICGDGVLKKKMQKFTHQNKLENDIEYLGWLNRNDLSVIYSTSHVFVQTSIHEAMSIAVMEALSSGTYILCTDVGNNRDLITPGINGELIAFNSPDKLAEQLENYYSDKFLNKYTIDKAAIENFRNKWDWKNIAPRYEKYFYDIIKAQDNP